MNITPAQGNDEAQEILEALRQIQDSDRLQLSGVARHAVAFGISGMLVATHLVKPAGWWN